MHKGNDPGPPAGTRDAPFRALEQTHGFETDVDSRVDRESMDLFSRRMATVCWVGAVLIPLYAFLDVSAVGSQLSSSNLVRIVAFRVLAGLVLAGAGLAFRNRWIPRRLLAYADFLLFFSVGLFLTGIVHAVWDVVLDYYIGLGQLIIARCMFLPGGPRRSIPTVIGLVATLPVGLLVFSGFDLAYLAGESGQRVVNACSGLAGLAALGALGSLVYDRALNQAVIARHQGRYRLDALIGQGGMGLVYRAWDTSLGRPCALKVIASEALERGAEAHRRFEREARKTSQLRGSHIVEIYDYGETVSGDLYYAMEYLDGMDVQSLVVRGGPLPASRVIHIASQVCVGLAEAHGQHLLHRDIKPANLFLTPRAEDPDYVKLLDFGLVKAIAGDEPQPGTSRASASPPDAPGDPARDEGLTLDGMLVGTPQYMAPEQVLGGETGPLCDIYALGGVMYEMLTGSKAFRDESVAAMFADKAYRPPAPPSTLRADIPADLDELVLRCMTPEPDKRYASALELRDALGRCEAAGTWTAQDAAEAWAELPEGGAPAGRSWTTTAALGKNTATVALSPSGDATEPPPPPSK